jgi:hypothetical protein
MLKILGARLAAGVAAMSLMVFAAEAAELQLKRVMLSSGGVGYFEYQAEVEGWETIEVPVRLDQVDDVLKSAVIFDDEGGSGVIELQGRDSLAEIFRTMPVGPDAFSSPANLYGALQGEEISVSEPVSATGRIVSVVEETATDANGNAIVRHRMSIMGSDGLVQFVLEDARGIKFTNEALDAKVNGALGALATNRQRELRTLKITARGDGSRTLTVGFVIEAPLWKTSYRLVTGPDNKTRMQGWAIIENASGADWKDVELTLVSGNPVTFRQALYDKYYVARESVPVEVLGRVMPQRDEGSIGGVNKDVDEAGSGAADRAASYEAAPAPPPPPPAPVAAKASAMPADPSNIASQSQESATAVSFTLPNAVSAGSGQSLAVPIIDREVPGEKISLYNPGVHAVNPLASIRLTNDTESGLPPGIVTLFDTTSGSTIYIGDAVMGTLPQGEKRMLSFALDQKTKVDQTQNSESNLTSAKITKGIIELQSLTRQIYTYTVKAPSNEDRALVLETPRHYDMELKSPEPSTVELTQNSVRVPFSVTAGQTGKIDIVWERIDTQTLALAGLDLSTVLYYAGDTRLSEQQRAAFQRVAELKQEIERLQGEINTTNAERDRLFAEQERIRQNLAAVPEGSDLQRRYLATLAEQEDRLTAIGQRLGQLQNELTTAQKALDDYVGTVTL